MTLSEIPDLDEIEAIRCAKSFYRFVKRAWQEVDPSPFVDTWHVGAIAEHLQALADGQLNKLIINIPPGHAKSLLCSVLWPAWVWISRPSWQLLTASYSEDLAVRDAAKSRRLMAGDWYRRHFSSDSSTVLSDDGVGWEFLDDYNRKNAYKNSKYGHREALGVGGRATGFRGDCLIIDDPLSVAQSRSKAARENCIIWKDQTMSSRFNDIKNSTQLLIMQRLHENDLTGHLLRKGGWEHLCLPAQYDPKRKSVTRRPNGTFLWQDPRKKEGELLAPHLLSAEDLPQLKRDLGTYGWAGQYEQLPAPAEGTVLKREWFGRRWLGKDQRPVEGLECRPLPEDFDAVSVWTDAAFKKTEDSDRVAVVVVGFKSPDVYILALDWRRMTFAETIQALLKVRAEWPSLNGVFVEDKANGPAIIETLSKTISGVVPVAPEGGKEARVSAVSPFIEAGNLWLPLSAPWLEDYIVEACAFPRAPHDDAIDATAYALLHYCAKRGGSLLDSL